MRAGLWAGGVLLQDVLGAESWEALQVFAVCMNNPAPLLVCCRFRSAQAVLGSYGSSPGAGT